MKMTAPITGVSGIKPRMKRTMGMVFLAPRVSPRAARPLAPAAKTAETMMPARMNPMATSASRNQNPSNTTKKPAICKHPKRTRTRVFERTGLRPRDDLMVSFPLPSYIVGHMTGGVSNVRRASPGQASAGAGVRGGGRLRGRASAERRMRFSVRRALGEGVCTECAFS